jgi:hypothetical protein
LSTAAASATTSSSSSARPKIALKDALKRFYLLVHPDRIQRPAERRVNEVSFAHLQQYLDDYQVSAVDFSAPSPPVDPHRVDLAFFLRRATTASAVDDADHLTKISVALHTPARSAGQRPDVKHLQKTCEQLFKAADLQLDFFVDSSFHSSGTASSSTSSSSSSAGHGHRSTTRSGPEATSVRDMLHKDDVSLAEAASRLASLARTLHSHRQRAEREADIVHASFQHSGLRAAFSIAGYEGLPPPAVRLELLLRLQQAVKGVSAERLELLRGVSFAICSTADAPVDAWGRVVLPHRAGAERWHEILTTVDLSMVDLKKFEASSLEHLEDRVAALLGMALVYHNFADSSHATKVYVRLLAEAEQQRLAPLVLPIKTPLGLMLSDACEHFDSSAHLGVFTCPASASLQTIRDYVALRAEGLAAVYVAHQRAVRDQERAIAEVRRLFGLRSLTFDPKEVTVEQMKHCLARLREREHVMMFDDDSASSGLAVYLPNVAMRVVNSPFYAVSPDGFFLVPHDFARFDA